MNRVVGNVEKCRKWVTMMPVYRRTRGTEPQLSGRRLQAHRWKGLNQGWAGGTNDRCKKKKDEKTRMRQREGEAQHTAHKRGRLACASSSFLRSCDGVESPAVIKPDPEYPSSSSARFRELCPAPFVTNNQSCAARPRNILGGPVAWRASLMNNRRALPTIMRTSEK